MKSRPSLALALCAWMGVSGVTLPARADVSAEDQAEAKRLFDEGRRLYAEGRHGEACQRLDESQRLDPSMGTEFYLAECLEKTGKLVAARDRYLHVAEVARASNRTDRAAFAIERLAALEPMIPTLVVAVSSPPEGLVIEVQGAPLAPARWGAPLLEDPGPLAWSARAPGKKPRAGTIELRAGQRATLTIEPLEGAAAAEAPPSAAVPVEVRGTPDPTQLILGIAVGATGVATLGVGGVFGLLAMDDYGASEDGPCDAQQRCTNEGLALRSDADTEATVSTIGFVAGGVLLAGGIVLVVSSPSVTDDTVALRVRPAGGDFTWRF